VSEAQEEQGRFRWWIDQARVLESIGDKYQQLYTQQCQQKCFYAHNMCNNTMSNKTGSVLWRNVEALSLTIFDMEKQELLNILSVCLYPWISYPVWTVRICCTALHCHVWSVWLYHLLLHRLINVTIFGKFCWRWKVCCDFLGNFSWKL